MNMNKQLKPPLDRCIERNKEEYKERYDLIPWVSPGQALLAAQQRQDLVDLVQMDVVWFCQGTKLVYGLRSPGCVCCAEGTWSCLFVSGHCNCDCFFCPSGQKGPDSTVTNNIPFHNPRDYADYVEQFGIKGVGLSGGEPLLRIFKTMEFIRFLRKRFGASLYIWMYTNGKLMTKDILSGLRDAGIDEIRFNIVPVGYSLEKAPEAAQIIPSVTVEIPAIPEDYERVTLKLREMAERGVRYLNLHQLRLTPYNFDNLMKRNYTFLHGEKVTVLESELTALRLVKYARDNHIPISINYCSFVYKNRYQGLAARRRGARVIKRSYEDITANGYIRYFFLLAPQERVKFFADALTQQGIARELWKVDNNRLYFSAALWDKLDLSQGRLYTGYCDTRILPNLTYYYPFEEIYLNRSKKIVVERIRVTEEMEISPEGRHVFQGLLKGQENPSMITFFNEKWQDLKRCEVVPSGLQNYF